MLLQFTLVVDVAWHRPGLWHAREVSNQAAWVLVVTTIFIYLQTCFTDPGWLHRSSSVTVPRGCFGVCCAAVVATIHLFQSTGSRDATTLGTELPLKSDSHGEVAGTESLGVSALVVEAFDADGIPKRRGNAAAEDTGHEGMKSGTLRWCKRCKLYQPLRAKHCYDCGICVRTHDHHCPWIGGCVGENNRILFFLYLFLQCIELLVFFIEGVNGISILEPSISLLLGLLTIAMFFIMVSCLLTFHTFLMLSNLTTWEHTSWMRVTYLNGIPVGNSPFARSILNNVQAYWCGPRWCPNPVRRLPGLRYDEADGILWELGEPFTPCCLLRCCAESF